MTFAAATEQYAEQLGRDFRGAMFGRLHQVLTGGGGTPVKTGRLRASGDVTRTTEPLQPPPPEGYDSYPWVPIQDIGEELGATPMSEDVRYAQTAPYAAKVWDMDRYRERLPAAIREVKAEAIRQAMKRDFERWDFEIGGGR